MDDLRAIYEDDVLALFWDAKAGYHIAEWHGFASGDRLRNAAHACLYAARERRSSLWLADVADFSVVGPNDQEWVVQAFYPQLAEIGVRWLAAVLPVKAPAQLSVQSIHSAYGRCGSIVFEHVATRAAAARWLGTR